MIPIETITPPDWMTAAPVRAVLAALEGSGDAPKILFVGGCVRNELLGLSAGDIDLATQFTPEEVIKRLEAAGLKAVPTGIEHGTVTAVADGQGFEITTLRKDVETDGRRAVVAFTQDWTEDAQRRDFTLNTLLAAPDGRIFDPLGCGFEDLKARRIIFAGDPATRIAEDVLRILRFFRFYVYYGDGEIDPDGLKACAAAADQIRTLSRERITQEFLKILAAEGAPGILDLMFKNGILNDLPDTEFQMKHLVNFLLPPLPNPLPVGEREAPRSGAGEGGYVLSRLFILGGMKAQNFDPYLILSNAQKRDLKALDEAFRFLKEISEKEIKKLIYYYKNKVALQAYFLRCAQENIVPDPSFIEILENWQAPDFPTTGEDLIAQGVPEGPELGAKLKALEEEWLETVI